MKNDGTVYYPILESKLSEKGIRKGKVQQLLNINYTTFCDKLNGRSDFSVAQAIKIQEAFFLDMTVNELFRPIEEEKK
ncbi:MAG: hypothetical protein IJZ64_01290 [Ruminococcus sp.]|nr:hypothetical protein [Ruminococcus sp.]